MTAEPSPHTLRRVEGIVERALRESGALGTLPTPLAALRDHAGVRSLEPVSALSRAPGARRGGVLGALWFEERVMFLQDGQSPPRRRFTEAHELMHALCPWHYAVLREDTEVELFGPVADAVEAEANAGAAMLIFQGSSFAHRAAPEPCSIATVQALAALHGASVHATMHHYVQSSARPVALLVVGRFPRKDRSLPVWRSVESPAFRARHGSVRGLEGSGVAAATALREVVECARSAGEGSASVALAGTRMRADALYNRHAFLILLAPAQPARCSRAAAAA